MPPWPPWSTLGAGLWSAAAALAAGWRAAADLFVTSTAEARLDLDALINSSFKFALLHVPYSTIDHQKTGNISYEDFVAYFSTVAEASEIDLIFNLIDGDRNRQITYGEFGSFQLSYDYYQPGRAAKAGDPQFLEYGSLLDGVRQSCDREAFLRVVRSAGQRFPPCPEWLVAAMAKEWRALPNLIVHWEYVTNPVPRSAEARRFPDWYGGFSVRDQGHEGWTVADFCRHATAARAGLTRAEVIALRLYTGPGFTALNRSLRANSQRFPVTQYCVDCAVGRLAQLSPAQGVFRGLRRPMHPRWARQYEVYRGIGNRRLLLSDPGIMSATTDLGVALGNNFGGPVIFVLHSRGALEEGTFMSTGADVEWLSQYPGEAEVLFPSNTLLIPQLRCNHDPPPPIPSARSKAVYEFTAYYPWDFQRNIPLVTKDYLECANRLLLHAHSLDTAYLAECKAHHPSLFGRNPLQYQPTSPSHSPRAPLVGITVDVCPTVAKGDPPVLYKVPPPSFQKLDSSDDLQLDRGRSDAYVVDFDDLEILELDSPKPRPAPGRLADGPIPEPRTHYAIEVGSEFFQLPGQTDGAAVRMHMSKALGFVTSGPSTRGDFDTVHGTNAFCRSRVRLYTQQDVVALEQASPHPQLEDGLDGEVDPVTLWLPFPSTPSLANPFHESDWNVSTAAHVSMSIAFALRAADIAASVGRSYLFVAALLLAMGLLATSVAAPLVLAKASSPVASPHAQLPLTPSGALDSPPAAPLDPSPSPGMSNPDRNARFPPSVSTEPSPNVVLSPSPVASPSATNPPTNPSNDAASLIPRPSGSPGPSQSPPVAVNGPTPSPSPLSPRVPAPSASSTLGQSPGPIPTLSPSFSFDPLPGATNSLIPLPSPTPSQLPNDSPSQIPNPTPIPHPSNSPSPFPSPTPTPTPSLLPDNSSRSPLFSSAPTRSPLPPNYSSPSTPSLPLPNSSPSPIPNPTPSPSPPNSSHPSPIHSLTTSPPPANSSSPSPMPSPTPSPPPLNGSHPSPTTSPAPSVLPPNNNPTPMPSPTISPPLLNNSSPSPVLSPTPSAPPPNNSSPSPIPSLTISLPPPPNSSSPSSMPSTTPSPPPLNSSHLNPTISPTPSVPPPNNSPSPIPSLTISPPLLNNSSSSPIPSTMLSPLPLNSSHPSPIFSRSSILSPMPMPNSPSPFPLLNSPILSSSPMLIPFSKSYGVSPLPSPTPIPLPDRNTLSPFPSPPAAFSPNSGSLAPSPTPNPTPLPWQTSTPVTSSTPLLSLVFEASAAPTRATSTLQPGPFATATLSRTPTPAIPISSGLWRDSTMTATSHQISATATLVAFRPGSTFTAIPSQTSTTAIPSSSTRWRKSTLSVTPSQINATVVPIPASSPP